MHLKKIIFDRLKLARLKSIIIQLPNRQFLHTPPKQQTNCTYEQKHTSFHSQSTMTHLNSELSWNETHCERTTNYFTWKRGASWEIPLYFSSREKKRQFFLFHFVATSFIYYIIILTRFYRRFENVQMAKRWTVQAQSGRPLWDGRIVKSKPFTRKLPMKEILRWMPLPVHTYPLCRYQKKGIFTCAGVRPSTCGRTVVKTIRSK